MCVWYDVGKSQKDPSFARYCGRTCAARVVLWSEQESIAVRALVCSVEKIVVDKPIPG